MSHGHVYLTIYDFERGKLVTVPSDLGFRPGEYQGVKGLCFEAAHTHDETGVLHTDFVEGNDLNLALFLKRWLPNINLAGAKLQVNGKTIVDPAKVTFEPEMDVKIFLGVH